MQIAVKIIYLGKTTFPQYPKKVGDSLKQTKNLETELPEQEGRELR